MSCDGGIRDWKRNSIRFPRRSPLLLGLYVHMALDVVVGPAGFWEDLGVAQGTAPGRALPNPNDEPTSQSASQPHECQTIVSFEFLLTEWRPSKDCWLEGMLTDFGMRRITL